MRTTKRYVRVPKSIIRSEAHMDPGDRAIGTSLHIVGGVSRTGVIVEKVVLTALILGVVALVIKVAAYLGATL